MQKTAFDFALASECAQTFYNVTGLGCSISTVDGQLLHSCGLASTNCQMCSLSGFTHTSCKQTQLYSLHEAERFGGKYIYFCPMGLTCFTSPILTMGEAIAQITVGPFLMVDPQDYIDIDLQEILHLPKHILPSIQEYLLHIPQIQAEKVEAMANMLFMMVAFVNDVSEANRLMGRKKADDIQKNIATYIYQLKGLSSALPYPFDTEKKLLDALSKADRAGAQKHLNELFGYIFFSTGNNLDIAKSRVYELLVLISRTAIRSGANSEHCLRLTHEYLQIIPELQTLDTLATWLSAVTSEFMDHVFNFGDIKHANAIYAATQYMQTHFHEKITLEQVAQRVFLSPSYFSRVFKRELGQPFSGFLNSLRIKKSKELLQSTQLKLIDIALAVGFDDQSYFTKIFKKEMGITPFQYRARNQEKHL